MNLNTTEGIASVINRLRKEERNCASVYIVDAAIETIERLVEERDAARREVCEAEKYCREEAKRRGWNCFKEETQ